jgi:predicted esterase
MTIHEGQPVLRGGADVAEARAVLILLHGRGASADDILSLGEQIAARVPGVALFAPQAANHTWYPERFLAPVARNEPYLTSALGIVGGLIAAAGKGGMGPESVVLLGFSQGACLVLEYAVRNPRRYGGVAGLSGALIGPPGTPRDPTRSLAATPVYLGCSDRDFHIPLASVNESEAVLRRLGADVRKSIFPGMGHAVNAEELDAVEKLVREIAG